MTTHATHTMHTEYFQMMAKAMGQTVPDLGGKVEHKCLQCGSDRLGNCNADVVCLDCKANMGSNIDHSPEWRNDKTSGEDLSRCNLARNDMLPESSLSTCITLGRNAPKVQHDLQRTITWNGVPHNERSMRARMEEIAYVCRYNDIPESIIEYAQYQYFKIIKSLEKKGMIKRRGRNDEGMRAAAVFVALKDEGKPRTYKEVARLFNIASKYVSEGINTYRDYVRPDNATTYIEYIDEFCRGLNLGEKIIDRVADIADRADELGILENNAPNSIAAGCIYYVAVEHALPLKAVDVAQSCGVSAPTINKVCNKLFNRTIDLIE